MRAPSAIRVLRRRRSPIQKRYAEALAQLRTDDGEAERKLEVALASLLAYETTVEEQRWLDQIERLRDDLLASTETVWLKTLQADVAVGDICRKSSVTSDWGLFLFRVVRELKPSVCLELGTLLGMSAAYQAAALDLNDHGRIATVDVSEPLTRLARENLRRLGATRAEVRNGRFQDLLGPLLTEIAPIDLAFIDGAHREDTTLGLFEQILPFTSDAGVLLFDDIAWSNGMKRAWAKIRVAPEVQTSLDFGRLGLCVISRDSELAIGSGR
jgi:predicted O-methyltransferase YrrM